MSSTIKRADALRQMETRETSQGKPNYFSIQFYKKDGELVSINRAKVTGLKADMTANRLRGIQAVDADGKPIGHIYPVSIDNIRMFNDQQVVI
jgi:hypothetical protein